MSKSLAGCSTWAAAAFRLAFGLSMKFAPMLGALGLHALSGARLRRIRCVLTAVGLGAFCRRLGVPRCFRRWVVVAADNFRSGGSHRSQCSADRLRYFGENIIALRLLLGHLYPLSLVIMPAAAGRMLT